MTLSMVYLTCFLVGFFYAIATAFMGGFGGDGHDVAVGHGADHGGHGGADAGHFSPLSPVIVASFVTVFGAAGFVSVKAWGLGTVPSMSVAVGAALAVGAAVFFVMEKIYMSTQASSESVLSTLVGKEAEVITPIPAAGFGEIAYVSKGTRLTAPARSASGDAIERREVVRIDKIVGTTHYVSPVGGKPDGGKP